MKTTPSLKKLAGACVFLLCLTTSSLVKAQIASPYPFTNNLTCDVQVYYDIFDSACNSACTGHIIIPAGNTVNIPVCAVGKEIYLTVDWIDVTHCPATQASPVNTMCWPVNNSSTVSTAATCNCNATTITAAATGASMP